MRVQRDNTPSMTPPPECFATLPASTQSFRALRTVPPPDKDALFERAQWNSVPDHVPPAEEPAAFPTIVQLDTTALRDSHQTPPPTCSFVSSLDSPKKRVPPLARVNPASVAPF